MVLKRAKAGVTVSEREENRTKWMMMVTQVVKKRARLVEERARLMEVKHAAGEVEAKDREVEMVGGRGMEAVVELAKRPFRNDHLITDVAHTPGTINPVASAMLLLQALMFLGDIPTAI